MTLVDGWTRRVAVVGAIVVVAMTTLAPWSEGIELVAAAAVAAVANLIVETGSGRTTTRVVFLLLLSFELFFLHVFVVVVGDEVLGVL